MAEQQRAPARIGAGVISGSPSIEPLADRGQRLHDLLMGTAAAAVRVAEDEGDRAYKEGIKARLNDVERENANDASKGVFAPLFRKRAEDGFDYQDATMSAAEFSLGEQMSMYESLKDSTNPADFEAWAAKRDEALNKQLEGKSDVFRTALAEQLQPARDAQARQFAGWVISNRERAARAAAAAAARAAAARAAAVSEAASRDAYGRLAEGAGDPSTFIADFVATAPARLGISQEEARDIAVRETVSYASATNNHYLLDGVDPMLLDAKERAGLGKVRAEILNRRKSDEAYEADLIATQEREEAKALERGKNELLFSGINQAFNGETDLVSLKARMKLNPYYQQNPDKMLEDMGRIDRAFEEGGDPVREAIAIGDFKEDIIGAAVAGEPVVDLFAEALGEVRSKEGRQQLVNLAQNVEKAVEDDMFFEVDRREKDFETLFENQAPETSDLAQMGLADPTPERVGVVTSALQDYKSALLEYHAEWYAENQGKRMGRTARLDIERRAFQETLDAYKAEAEAVSQKAKTAASVSAVDTWNAEINARQGQ